MRDGNIKREREGERKKKKIDPLVKQIRAYDQQKKKNIENKVQLRKKKLEGGKNNPGRRDVRMRVGGRNFHEEPEIRIS